MRNRWFPARVADYVPAVQLKQLKAQELDFSRDFSYGVRANLEEVEEDEDVVAYTRHVRPIEIDVLSVCTNHLAKWPTLTRPACAIHGAPRYFRPTHHRFLPPAH
jgi:hypothetical protein